MALGRGGAACPAETGGRDSVTVFPGVQPGCPTPVTLPLVFTWGNLILTQGLTHYTCSKSLLWAREEKHDLITNINH